ncbi:hypothetical protein HY404_03920 [Candidatus Microgenomates bacterium]|nr:hypothetical protein [Candidatus Microgenomates bacterium]
MIIKIFLLTLILAIGGFWLFSKIGTIVPGVPLAQNNTEKAIETCGEDCANKITEAVSRAIATLSAQPTVELPKTSSTKVNYVTISGAGSSIKLDWEDLSITDFYLNTREYGSVKDTRWYATIKLKDGNGRAWVRLFNVTRNEPVESSVMSTNSQTFTTLESDLLKLRSDGKANLYRVQLKTESGYEVTFDSGKVKIISY